MDHDFTTSLREPRRRRPLSRSSSGSTTHSRATARITNSTSSPKQHPIARAPTHTVQRHHSHCGGDTASRKPPSRAPRDMVHDSRRGKEPGISSYFQERLQQERRTAGKRPAQRLGDVAGGPVLREEDARSNPSRRSETPPSRRPRSDCGDETGSPREFGSKEMEKSLSTLHKQNFDLKLELYHRRGRQDALEARNAKLEDERAEMTEIHESLLAELERRDQALNEAIQLVMELECQVSDLTLEHKIMRRAEADVSDCDPCEEDALGGRSATPRARGQPGAGSANDTKSLERMPSFMAEPSEHTKILRSVVLDKRNSLSHLRKVSETSTVPSDVKRVASPSLISVLSESSFLSVYGDGGDNDDDGVLPPLIQLQSPSDASLRTTREQGQRCGNTAPRSVSSGTFNGGSSQSARVPAAVNLLDTTSPLQQIEKLEQSYAVERYPPKRTASSRDRASCESPRTHSSPTASLNPPRVREAKKDALRKVMTSTPTEKDMPTHRTLPPTPDTVSTSTLRRFRDSMSNMSSRTSSAELSRQTSCDRESGEAARHASMTSSAGRREMLAWQMGTDKAALPQRLAPLLPRPPRSVHETVSAQDRDSNNRAPESDPSDGGDTRSEDSNFDYWMREGTMAREQPPSDDDLDSLPDLFEVPGTDAMFGAIRGSGFSPVPGLGRGSQDGNSTSVSSGSKDAIFRPPAPKEADGGLIAPSRRSSLHARVGSFTGSIGPTAGEQLGQNPAREHRWATSRRSRSRSSSVDATSLCSRQAQTPSTKRSLYPPITGQSAKSKGLNGLNGLFHRSAESPRGARCPSPRQQQAQSPGHYIPSGRMSVPPPPARPWDRRLPDLSDDERASATPPPIMRQRAPRPISTSADAPAAFNVGRMQDQDFEYATRPRTAIGLDSSSVNTGACMPRRSRWLGLSLIGGLKKGTV